MNVSELTPLRFWSFLLALKGYGSLNSCSSGDSSGEVLRFETLEHSIEGALQELECIDASPPSPAEDSLSCEDSSLSDSTDHEASAEHEPEEGGPLATAPDAAAAGAADAAAATAPDAVAATAPDAAAVERKPKHSKSAVGPKAKPSRPKKTKAKTSASIKKVRVTVSKQMSDIPPEPLPSIVAPDEPTSEPDRDTGDAARKLKALVSKQRAERENWAAKLRKAKEMGLEVVSKVL